MADAKFLDGLIVKNPHQNAPDFVIGTLSFRVDEVIQSLKNNEKNGWVNTQIKKSKEGKLYVHIDQWEPNKQGNSAPTQNNAPAPQDNDDDLPF